MNKRAPTYFGGELLRQTQEAALKEWNAKPHLPRWDRDEQMVYRIVGWRRLGPLYYLKPKAESAPGKLWPGFERWASKQPRRVVGLNSDEFREELCNRLFVELKGSWLRRAEETLEGIDVDRRSNLALQIEKRSKQKTPEEAKAEGEAAARTAKFEPLPAEKRLHTVVEIVKTVPPPSKDVLRRDVLLGLRELLGRGPAAREAGLASILCGAPVVGPTSVRPVMSVARAIEKEVHAMTALLRPKKSK